MGAKNSVRPRAANPQMNNTLLQLGRSSPSAGALQPLVLFLALCKPCHWLHCSLQVGLEYLPQGAGTAFTCPAENRTRLAKHQQLYRRGQPPAKALPWHTCPPPRRRRWVQGHLRRAGKVPGRRGRGRCGARRRCPQGRRWTAPWPRAWPARAAECRARSGMGAPAESSAPLESSRVEFSVFCSEWAGGRVGPAQAVAFRRMCILASSGLRQAASRDAPPRRRPLLRHRCHLFLSIVTNCWPDFVKDRSGVNGCLH